MSATSSPHILVTSDGVAIDGYTSRDPVLIELLGREPDPGRAALLDRILEVGARGVLTMGVGIDLAEVDARVKRSLEAVTEEARHHVEGLLTRTEQALGAALDPDQRTSLLARALAEFGGWRDDFLAGVDPGRIDSHTGRLLAELGRLLGPGGAFETRLRTALDPTSHDSGIGQLAQLIDRRFVELRETLAVERGRAEETDRGTRKGFRFEDQIEVALREAVRGLGAAVDRTSSVAGLLAGEAMVGDFIVEMPTGQRIVIEAKNTRSISLSGADGILSELDRAIANRSADVAICVSAQDAYPREVGPFGVYGNRILTVDDGDGTMLWVALRWAVALAAMTRTDCDRLDMAAVTEKLDRIKQLGQMFKANRRALTDITTSVEKVRSSLDGMRLELLALVDDIDREIAREAEPVTMPRAV